MARDLRLPKDTFTEQLPTRVLFHSLCPTSFLPSMPFRKVDLSRSRTGFISRPRT